MMAARKLKFKPKPSVNVLNIRRAKEADEAVNTIKEEEKVLKNQDTNLESEKLGVTSEENDIVNGYELNKNNIDCKPLESSLSLAENSERLDSNLVSSPQSNDTNEKRISEEAVATENVMNRNVVSALNSVSIVENTGCGDAVPPLAADSNDKSKTISNKPGSSGGKVFSRLGRSRYKPILSNPDLRKKGDAGTSSEVSQPRVETLKEEPRVKCEVTINSTDTKLFKEEVLENNRPSVTDTSSIVHQLNNQRTESVIKSVESELSKTQSIVSEITESFTLLEDSEEELPHKLNLNRASHASGNFSLSNNVDIENINIDLDSSVNLKEIVCSSLKMLNDSNKVPVSPVIYTDVKGSDNLAEIIRSSLKPLNSSNKVPVSPVIFTDVNGSDNLAEIIRSSLKPLNSSNKVPVSPVRTTSKVLVPKPSPRISEVSPRRISFQGSDSEEEVKKKKSYRKKDNSKISIEAKDNNSLNNSKRKRSQGSTYSKMSQETLEKISKKFGKNEEPDKTKLTMIDLIFYNPKNNPMPQSSHYKPKKKEKTMETDETIEEKMEEEKVDDVEPAAIPVPQLKIGPDGQIMLDPQSLVIETTGTEEGRAKLEKSEVIQDTGITRYSTYRKKRHVRSEWSRQETLQFFRALNTVGTDFTLMTKLFPNRSRHELKLKFKREEKANLRLVDKAMIEKVDFDFNSLQEEFQQENEIIIRKNKEKKLAAEAAQKERAMKKEEMLKNKGKRKPGNRYTGRGKAAALKDFNETDQGTCYNRRVKLEPGQRKRKTRNVCIKESSDLGMGEQLHIDFQSSSEEEEQQLNLLRVVRQTRFGRLPKRTSKLEEYEEINETLKKKLQQESDLEEDGYIPNGLDAQMLFGNPLPDNSTAELEDHNDLTEFRITDLPTIEETVLPENFTDVSEISELGSFGQNDSALDLSMPVRANVDSRLYNQRPDNPLLNSQMIAQSFHIVEQLTSNVQSNEDFCESKGDSSLSEVGSREEDQSEMKIPLPSFESVSHARPSMVYSVESNLNQRKYCVENKEELDNNAMEERGIVMNFYNSTQDYAEEVIIGD